METRRNPRSGKLEVLTGEGRNRKWRTAPNQNEGKASTPANIKDIKKDFIYPTDEEDVSVSVFDKEFTDVLYDRYGKDPRVIDDVRSEMEYDIRQLVKESRRLQGLVDSNEKSLINLEKKGLKDSRNYRAIEKSRVKTIKKKQGIDKEISDIQQKYEDYTKENPVEWPQYWLVSNGHFHTSTQCSSLHPTTMIGLYSPASGMEEDEAIELAGDRICTICIPDAPVSALNTPSTIMTREEREEKEAKDEVKRLREEKKREKEEKKKQREEKAKEKKKAQSQNPSLTLDEPLAPPNIGAVGWDNMAFDSTSTIKDLRGLIKQSYVNAVLSPHNLDPSLSMDSNKKFEMDSVRKEFEDGEQRAAVFKKNFNDPDKFWATALCRGSADDMVTSLHQLRESTQVLADKKGKSLEKMINDVFGTRTNNTILKALDKRARDRFWEEGYEDVVNRRIKAVQSWINNPESFRDYIA